MTFDELMDELYKVIYELNAQGHSATSMLANELESIVASDEDGDCDELLSLISAHMDEIVVWVEQVRVKINGLRKRVMSLSKQPSASRVKDLAKRIVDMASIMPDEVIVTELESEGDSDQVTFRDLVAIIRYFATVGGPSVNRQVGLFRIHVDDVPRKGDYDHIAVGRGGNAGEALLQALIDAAGDGWEVTPILRRFKDVNSELAKLVSVVMGAPVLYLGLKE